MDLHAQDRHSTGYQKHSAYLGNEFIILVKDTSIVSFIAVVDITKAFRQIGDANYDYIIPYLCLALVYLVLVLMITLLIRLIERRFKRSDRV